MTTVYRVAAGTTERFIRATSEAAARVRAWKAFGIHADSVQPLGIGYTQALGGEGYDKACNTSERPMREAVETDRYGYDVGAVIPAKEAKRIDNKARAAIIALGLTVYLAGHTA